MSGGKIHHNKKKRNKEDYSHLIAFFFRLLLLLKMMTLSSYGRVKRGPRVKLTISLGGEMGGISSTH